MLKRLQSKYNKNFLSDDGVEKIMQSTSYEIPKWLTLHPYQEQAIKSWQDNNYQGLFEMATGTGKTLTALSAACKLFQAKKRLAIIVVCPLIDLVDQWAKNAEEFGLQPVRIYQNRKQWFDLTSSEITQYNIGNQDVLCFITTMQTLKMSKDVQLQLGRLSKESLIIVDEAHNIGTSRSIESLPSHFKYRLALSATPRRWNDDEGTDAIFSYFGGEPIFKYELRDAIHAGYLTPYYYYPQIVVLTDSEREEYMELSKKIAKLFASQGEDTKNEYLEQLLIKRARLINSAENKEELLKKLLKKQKNDGDMRHTIVYCGDQKKEGERQVDRLVQMMGKELGVYSSSYTSHENNKQRRDLLSQFDSGEIEALIAIRCLDEGVDVPNTRTAYILASSSNPKEFIQRRGRVLRKARGKEFAILYDFIVISQEISDTNQLPDADFNIERSLLEKELRRVQEFASLAINGPQASQTLLELKNLYNLQHL